MCLGPVLGPGLDLGLSLGFSLRLRLYLGPNVSVRILCHWIFNYDQTTLPQVRGIYGATNGDHDQVRWVQVLGLFGLPKVRRNCGVPPTKAKEV